MLFSQRDIMYRTFETLIEVCYFRLLNEGKMRNCIRICNMYNLSMTAIVTEKQLKIYS